MTRGAFISTLGQTLGVTILTVVFSELGSEAEDDLLDYKSVGELLDILDRKHAFKS